MKKSFLKSVATGVVGLTLVSGCSIMHKESAHKCSAKKETTTKKEATAVETKVEAHKCTAKKEANSCSAVKKTKAKKAVVKKTDTGSSEK